MKDSEKIQSFIINKFEEFTKIKIIKNPQIDHRKSDFKTLDSF